MAGPTRKFTALEQAVKSCVGDYHALGADELISHVRQQLPDTRAIDVKIAAMGMYLDGHLGLDDAWQFVPVAKPAP